MALSGFSTSSTAEEVTQGIDGTGLTAIVTELLSLLGKFVLKTIQQGAATTCYVALNPQVRGISGKYFVDSNLAEPSSHGTDTDLAKKLWDLSMKMIE